IVFSTQPTATTAGVALTPAVVVTAQDSLGNTATSFTANVTVAIASNPGSSTLSGTATVAASSGVATFSTLTLDMAASGYTLSTSATGLTGATSATFNVVPGPAITVMFTSVPPWNVTAGLSIAPPVHVKAFDAQGNVVTTFTGNVTVAI